MTTPEARARTEIDALLIAAGWQVQDRTQLNLRAAAGVAVREFSLTTGFADYLLFVNGKAIGAVEAKAVGTALSGVELQTEQYSDGLPKHVKSWARPLPFLYQSTGIETFFTDRRDPQPRSRRVFAFHQPATLATWASEADSLRARLQHLPPLVHGALWPAQIEAITNLEHSLAEDRPRALIQMATGSGKTFTAVSFIYRLIKHANARRVLFLVDRGNLGRQTLREFQQYVTPDDGRKFTELYNVQQLQSNTFDPVSRVCITTIQRLYSMLHGEEVFDPENEEISQFELDDQANLPPRDVRFNGRFPIEQFDVIVTDECHRSIYNLWRQVLEYFDAHLIGLTATPSKQTFGFFNQNLVMEYSRQRAVIDGVNVDGDVYRIRTAITEGGSTVEAGFTVGRRNRQTRQVRWEAIDEDLTYSASQLDRDVVAESQIRTIIRAFRDRLFTEIFPGRTDVPKTLIFAKDDNHAEEIVRIVREEFAKGNDFCQKITYKSAQGARQKPEDLIASFRNSYNPRVAVTVDMIATGTDIKPLECLLFLRTVKSRILFEQMLGRGTRVINPTDLIAVTPDATRKERFVIIDAVGVVDQPKADTQTLERKRTVAFDKLLDLVAQGARDEDTLSSLAGRLAKLEKTLTEQEQFTIRAASGGHSPADLARTLLDAIDADQQILAAQAATGQAEPDETALTNAAEELADAACVPFANPTLRTLLAAAQQRNDLVIDQVSIDQIREIGYSTDATARARATVDSFERFLADHRDEITALQILFGQPYAQRQLTYREIKELAQRLAQPPLSLKAETLWLAYAQLERDKVRGASAKRVLTDLISLVRHTVHRDETLAPFPEQVAKRYQQWLETQAALGRHFTPRQRNWLDKIAEQIGVNLAIAPDDFATLFHNDGGHFAVVQGLGDSWRILLDELNETLAA
jgi:type I restriction enzyme R subunit